ncbi:transcription-repair coupling factor [Halioxenophilus sp. WMMB6]|uniref:transcription-repair coupling factor n=1 Tax=Halioxenophilus sp. WMMB6 TaxID=3073815 RepID=UPI00295F1302|nr:transcription-repair coupling factor [Halioxenophilus sp. WMMB6]
MFSPLAPPCYKPLQSIWGNLPTTAAALTLMSAARLNAGAHLVITPDNRTALQLEQEITALGQSCPQMPPVIHFPDRETLPFDHFSPNADIISDRLEALYRLSSESRYLVTVPITLLLTNLPPRGFVDARSLVIKCGEQLDLKAACNRLNNAGYHRVDTVLEHGEYAVRGAIVDIFAMGSHQPFRIDLFDDEVDSIRSFDPSTQLTVDSVQEIKLLPAHEFPLDDGGIRLFRDQWHSHFDVDHKNCPVYQDVCQGISPPGIEYYLPLFYEQMATLFDYLPEQLTIYSLGDIHSAAENFWQEIRARFENLNVDPRRPLLPPKHLYLTTESCFQTLKTHAHIKLESGSNAADLAQVSPLPELGASSHEQEPLAKLRQYLAGQQQRTLICADTNGRREILQEQLAKQGIKAESAESFWQFVSSDWPVAITLCPIERGFVFDEGTARIALVGEADLYGTRIAPQRRRRKAIDATEQVIKHLTELNIDSPVVHIDHGVGRYRGLQMIEIDGQMNEFLTLEYADAAKLYVPVANLHLISRYSGADEALAPLHRLGTDTWSKAKQKAAEKVRDVAAELLDIYAHRAAKKGRSFDYQDELYSQFAKSFPFQETEDQQSAIDAVLADMKSARPMDRLVCGDVGFGKTEVAIRAAFVAAICGKQVAVMVPTTLLAQQHYDNFTDRFAQWPVKVGLLSRFQTTSEINKTLAEVKSGQLDIVIGTHKLIQQDVKYHDLGLVIIDEEHRFGVRQKDRFKSLRAEVDVLALTATPIPRTLNLSMQGVRDLSIIATPPAKRLSVKTFVQEKQAGLLKEAVLREILRGGQVYYLHNEVKTIDKMAEELRELIPEARISIGHGQMRERELEVVMNDFYHKRFNVLVATTIIETGLDIPNANTIIIERADKFGLAQLHQLRGRVGRSHHQAYAYLLTPPGRKLTPDAQKRLEAISLATELGSGFTLATHDLEIRGAGELLGEEQSGQIQHVGFSLYMDMLDRAVKAIRSGKMADASVGESAQAEINLRIPALIPEDYLPDVNQRLMLYKRLSNTENEQDATLLQMEIIDRFGSLPEPTKNLIRVTLIRLQSEQLGIQKIEASSEQIKLEFAANTKVNPMAIVNLVQKQPKFYALDGANKLKFKTALPDAMSKLEQTEQLLDRLTQ